MNRLDFIKRLGLGAAAAVAAPTAINAIIGEKERVDNIPVSYNGKTWPSLDEAKLDPEVYKMGDIKVKAFSSLPYEGYDLEVDPAVWDELYEKYGDVEIFDLLTMT